LPDRRLDLGSRRAESRRTPLLALLALGCALAAAAAGTGPFLVSDRQVPPFALPLRRTATRFRPRRPLIGNAAIRAVTRTVDDLLQVIVALIAVTVVAVGVYRLFGVLVRLTRLRLGRSHGSATTQAYDAGEQDDSDAEAVLRRRVADELGLLSADLDARVDPREAVIACYVRMEAAFADAGSARDVTETPTELMARVLTEQHVPANDVRRLTDLFTEARFSAHPVDDDMRDAARRSLRNVAASLGAAV